MTNSKRKMMNGKSFFLGVALIAFSLILAVGTPAQVSAPSTSPQTDLQGLIARQAALVTEFDVNGMKVLVKRREGSQTVAAGLFLKGGSRNITAANAGVESLM